MKLSRRHFLTGLAGTSAAALLVTLPEDTYLGWPFKPGLTSRDLPQRMRETPELHGHNLGRINIAPQSSYLKPWIKDEDQWIDATMRSRYSLKDGGAYCPAVVRLKEYAA